MTADDNEDLGESPKTIGVKMSDLLADPTEDHRYLQIDDAMKRQLNREFKQNHDCYNNDPYRKLDPYLRDPSQELAQVVLALAQDVRRSSVSTSRAIQAMETISRQTTEILDKYITDLAIANKSTEVWRVRYEALLEHQGG